MNRLRESLSCVAESLARRSGSVVAGVGLVLSGSSAFAAAPVIADVLPADINAAWLTSSTVAVIALALAPWGIKFLYHLFRKNVRA